MPTLCTAALQTLFWFDYASNLIPKTTKPAKSPLFKSKPQETYLKVNLENSFTINLKQVSI